MSMPKTFATGSTPRIVLKSVHGHLALSGWDRPEVQVRVRNGEGLTSQEIDGSLELTCRDHCVVQAPFQATLHGEAIGGDATISMILGGIDLRLVDGDLRIASIGAATIGTVGGDLNARAVAGSLAVAAVDGDVRVAQIGGELELGSVGGDLNLHEVAGNIHAHAKGDARLSVSLAPGQEVVVNAGGDIACRVPMDVNAAVRLRAGGDITVKRLGEFHKTDDSVLAFELGNGDGASLQLATGGDLLLRGAEMAEIDMHLAMDAEIGEDTARRAAELSLQITRQVEAQVANLTQELEERLGKMSNSDELASKIQDRVQAALRRAEEKLAEAMHKIEARVQEAEQRSSEDASRSRRKAYTWQAPSSPRPPRPPKSTDEERMMVLRMVEEGKLSVEQAEQLLAAMNQ